jgi:hypothetical protein
MMTTVDNRSRLSSQSGREARSRTRTDDPFLTMAARGLRLFAVVRGIWLKTANFAAPASWPCGCCRVLCCPGVAHGTTHKGASSSPVKTSRRSAEAKERPEESEPMARGPRDVGLAAVLARPDRR